MSDARWTDTARVPQFENTEVSERRQFIWEITDWDALSSRATSPPFECGGIKWQILLFPRGNPSSSRKGSVALYLNAIGPATGDNEPEVVDLTTPQPEQFQTSANSSTNESAPTAAKANTNWHQCCAFALAMWNPEYSDTIICQTTNHRFTVRMSDWGYNEFTTLRSAFVRQQKHSDALISPTNPPDDPRLRVNIGVNMETLADPTGFLWHDFQDYNSRDATGYTGLVNQGATCYLNSLIQSLYFTKAFRNAVYSLPDSQGGVTGGLQRLFYKLSTSEYPVDTTDLTQAFGWDSADAFTQHDVQELARVLMDRVEAKMKGTEVDGFLSKLFVGQMKSYIKCINVPFESGKTEDFWDIQLNVRGMRDVYESFRDYCTEETLEGDNQYSAGEHGLQDAVKGVKFEYLPAVLHLQLKRYDFDWMREIQVKINDRYEFALNLDLSPFVLQEGAWQYDLYGVLVHAGDLNAGHYYALIKPEPTTDPAQGWYKFDDDRVTKATVREVLEANFGGDEGSLLKRVTSAYMLVYVKRDAAEFVLPSGAAGNELPTDVAERFEREQRENNTRMKAIAEQMQYMNILVATPDTVRHHSGPGVLPWSDESAFPPAEHEKLINFKVRIGTDLSQLLTQFNSGTVWLATSEDDTRACQRKLQQIPTHRELTVDQLAAWTKQRTPIVFVGPSPEDVVLLDSENEEESPDLQQQNADQRLVFLKSYEDGELKMLGLKWVYTNRPLKNEIENLVPRGVPEDSFRLFIEVTQPSRFYSQHYATMRPQRLVQIEHPEASVNNCNVESGDILVLSCKVDSPQKYFDALQNRLTMELVQYDAPDEPIMDHFDPTAKGITSYLEADDSAKAAAKEMVGNDAEKTREITISIEDPYETILQKISKAFGRDPKRLQLRSLPPDVHKSRIIASSGENIADLWSFYSHDTVQVLCRPLPIDLVEYENLSDVVIEWLPEGYMGTSKTETIIGAPENKLIPEKCHPENYIISATQHSRRCNELRNPTLGDLYDIRENKGWDLFVTPLIPLEAKARAVRDGQLCMCFHFHRDINRVHGIPFNIAVVPGENWGKTKIRIGALLRHTESGNETVPSRLLEKIQFTIVTESDIVMLEDDSIVLYDVLEQDCYIGLEHPDRSTGGFQQQAIHID